MPAGFDFVLPEELIAQRPAVPRDHARLLVYNRANRSIIDDHFYNLDKYLDPSTTLVLNDSKVEKCRLVFGSTEIFVLETLDPYTVQALVRPGKKFKVDDVTEIEIASGSLSVQTLAVDAAGIRTLRLSKNISDPELTAYRRTPLPPYIKPDESLASEYQTIYSAPLGSKAAPTAGLHFTAAQLAALSKKHQLINVTLHVGLGTFAPIKGGDINAHVMHSENFIVTSRAAASLNSASHITAVGTTSVRVLETCSRPFEATSRSTNIFIRPGYKFSVVDSLITNFHLPHSTLLLLVAAFIGSGDELQRIYSHAISRKYRFYSFGDAMLII